MIMKKYLNTVVALLFLTVPSLYAYNNQWSNNEDYVVVNQTNTEPGEGKENTEVKGATTCPTRKGSPVYVKSGDFTWSDTDIVLPGKSGIYFSRSYTSKEPLSGMFGNGWISNLESGFIKTTKHIDNDGTEEIYYIYRKENGLRYTFKEINGTIEAPSGMYYDFKRLSPTSYQVTDASSKVTDTYKNDLLISKEDANGNKREYVYDENGILQSIKDGNGNTLTLTFGGNGYVTAITDQNERTWSYDYDGEGNLVSVTDPLDGVLTYDYEKYQPVNDAQFYYHLTKITDETDKTVIDVTYNSGLTGGDAYKNGRVNSYTVGENTYSYDWQYLSKYKEVDKSDSLGNKTEMYMLDSGHIYKYKNPRGEWLIYNIDKNSTTLTGVTDKNGNDWNQSVDDRGRIISKTTPLGNKTSFKYEGDRRVPSQMTSALGHVTKIAYDDKQNPTMVTLPDNSTYKFTYDTKGNVLDLTNPSGVKTGTITYNVNSQATSIKNALDDTVSMSYNALGQITTVTDAKGNVVTYTHDILGNLTKTVNAMGHSVVYTYDKSGRLLSLKDPVGNTTTYEYDSYGRLSKVTRPNGRTLTYAYNTANQVTTVTDSAGRETVLTYDELGNVTEMKRGDSWISYGYDANNNLTVVNSDFSKNGHQYFYYDKDNRLIQDWFRDRVYYSYDADGRLATIKVKNKTITYTRNALGNLSSLSDGTNTFSFTYDANGQRKSITYPNGMQVTYGLNNASQLTTLDNGLKQSSYTYDKNGMMTQKTVDGVGTDYSYDTAGRLTDAGADNYSYDTSGNILNNAAVYDATTNQLESTATHTYEYDAFGNLTKKTDKTTGDYKVYTWNDWDMLISVESFDNNNTSTKKIEYTYDPSGRRDTKTVNGKTYTYDNYGNTPIAIYDNSNRNYIWFLYDEGIDRPLAIINDITSETYFYHRNYLGSITALSDSSQNVVESYTYDAYGKTVKSSSVETGNPFAYAGREMDDEDLYYYRSRYYDPTVGRFLSEDQIGFASGDFNFYRYVLNNPVNMIDPYGYGFFGTIGSMIVGGGVAIVATGAAIVSAPVAIGAGAGLVIYGTVSVIYDAGQTMKTIIKRKKENAKIKDPIKRYEANKKVNSWGLKKAKQLTNDAVTAPGTGLGGDPITSVEDVVVTVVNAAAGDTIYSSKYRKKHRNHHSTSCK